MAGLNQSLLGWCPLFCSQHVLSYNCTVVQHRVAIASCGAWSDIPAEAPQHCSIPSLSYMPLRLLVWCMQVLTKCCRHWRSGRTVAGVAGAEEDGAGVEAGAEGLVGRSSRQADRALTRVLNKLVQSCHLQWQRGWQAGTAGKLTQQALQGYHYAIMSGLWWPNLQQMRLGNCLAPVWPIVLYGYVGGPCEHPLEPLAHWLVPRSGLCPNYCTVPSYNDTRALATAEST